MTLRRPLLALSLAVLATTAAVGLPPSGAGGAPTEGTGGAQVHASTGEVVDLVLPPPAERGGVAPGSPGSATETVSLPDGRRKVRFPTTYPNRVVGQLQFDQDGGGFLCTAWLIDANTVLTSGHCVHEGGAGGLWSTDLSFAPGRQATRGGAVRTDPYGTCSGVQSWAPKRWVVDNDPAHDWGLVHLDCDIGDEIGWMGIYSLPGARDLEGRRARLQGYPGDKPFGTYWWDRGRVVHSNLNLVFYTMDTFGGQSGSPVWHRRSGCGPCAAAVHSYGFVDYDSPFLSLRRNHGPRINPARFEVITDLAAGNDT